MPSFHPASRGHDIDAKVVPDPPALPSKATLETTRPAVMPDGTIKEAELHHLRDALDHIAHAGLARLTSGLSPAALVEAYTDWALHLSTSPGKQVELAVKAARKWMRLSRFIYRCAMAGGTSEACITPPPHDLRFASPEWQRWPYNVICQAFLLQEEWWHDWSLFLDNDLAEGRFLVGGRPITVRDIRAPIFAVGTERDHVAPWRSAFKIHLLTDTDITFLLTTGGHNAGIVSGSAHPTASFQILTKAAGDAYLDPGSWAKIAPRFNGSWWPVWADWLALHSGAPVPPPGVGRRNSDARLSLTHPELTSCKSSAPPCKGRRHAACACNAAVLTLPSWEPAHFP